MDLLIQDLLVQGALDGTPCTRSPTPGMLHPIWIVLLIVIGATLYKTLDLSPAYRRLRTHVLVAERMMRDARDDRGVKSAD